MGALTHTLLRPTPDPWRYLHSRLVPSPDAVAEFVTTVLSDPDRVALPYPARFRRTDQPLEPVLDALTEHTQRHAGE